MTVKEMFTNAKNYAIDKFSELEKKNTPYSQSIHRKILKEQKQLAAKYASEASRRENLDGIDFYYLGRLHWLATNSVDSALAFEKFLATPSTDTQKQQTARSVVRCYFPPPTKIFEKAEKNAR